MRSLYREPKWFEADAELAANEEDEAAQAEMAAATKRVSRRAEQEFRGRVQFVSPDDYRKLNKQWGEAYWMCYVAISYQWIGDGNE